MASIKTTLASVEAEKHQDQVIKNLELAIFLTIPDPVEAPHKSITQKEILKKAGLSSNVLYSFFAKKSNMTLINLIAICKVLEIDPSVIISETPLTTNQIKFNKALNELDEIKLLKVMSILEGL